MTWQEDSGSIALGVSTIAFLREEGFEEEYGAGETILARGEQADALYVLLAGEVELQLKRGPHRLALRRLRPGSTFGEESLLRGLPASSDFVARTAVKILRYPSALFPTALQERESFMRKIMGRLAKNLYQTTAEAWDLFSRAESLEALVRQDAADETMIAPSSRSQTFVDTLRRRAESNEPLLLIGEEGTGKRLAARTVHRASRADGPFVIIDCHRLTAEAAGELFGRIETGGGLEAPGLRVATGGSLVLAGIEALPHRVQRSLATILASQPNPCDGARLLATCCEPARLDPSLADSFPNPLEMLPLRRRAREIVPLARHFVERVARRIESKRILTPDAERMLVSLQYRFRNVAELRDIIDLAARCSDGPDVRSEHIAVGISPEAGPLGTPVPLGSAVDRVLRSRVPSWLRGATLATFLLVIWICLAAAGSTLARVANGFIWSAWEPAVFTMFLIVGPVWCTVCPLSTGGRLAQRLGCLGRSVPKWIKTYGSWIAAAGLLFILWVERATRVIEQPVATALLLTGLLASSVALCLIFRREVWCRYICPLGHLKVAAAPAAPVSLAAPPTVCFSTCTSHDCYRGTAELPGCTVFHHPRLASQSHHCKLCLDCLRTCPHQSTAVYLRPPLSGVSTLVSAESYVVPFALAVFLIAPLFLAAQRGGLLADPTWLGVAGILALALAALIAWRLPWWLGSPEGDVSPVVPRVALGLAVLGWGPLLAYEFGHIDLLARVRLVADPALPAVAGDIAGLTLQTLVRLAVILATAIATGLVLRRARQSVESVPRWRWRWLLAGVWTYAAGMVTLIS